MRERGARVAAELETSRRRSTGRGRRGGARSSPGSPTHNFTFLGYREYDVGEDGEPRLAVRAPASAILRQEERARTASTSCRRGARAALEPYLLNLTKANSRATVHRAAYLDYVGVKRFDDDGR